MADSNADKQSIKSPRNAAASCATIDEQLTVSAAALANCPPQKSLERGPCLSLAMLHGVSDSLIAHHFTEDSSRVAALLNMSCRYTKHSLNARLSVLQRIGLNVCKALDTDQHVHLDECRSGRAPRCLLSVHHISERRPSKSLTVIAMALSKYALTSSSVLVDETESLSAAGAHAKVILQTRLCNHFEAACSLRCAAPQGAVPQQGTRRHKVSSGGFSLTNNCQYTCA